MGVLIDTSVLIDAERGRTRDLTILLGGRRDEAFVSAITASELLHGVLRAQTPAQGTRRSSFVESALQALPVLPADLRVARSHAQLWAQMASRGERIGAHDLWIAATAVAHGYGLATTNLRDFGRVPGLTVEDWSAPGA